MSDAYAAGSIQAGTSTQAPEQSIEVRHLLKTARRAKEMGNVRREAELLEEAIRLSPEPTPHMLRRLASALYRNNEYRAAGLVAADNRMLLDGGEEFTNRLREQLIAKNAFLFLDLSRKLQSFRQV